MGMDYIPGGEAYPRGKGLSRFTYLGNQAKPRGMVAGVTLTTLRHSKKKAWKLHAVTTIG